MATQHAQISEWRWDLLPHIVDRLAVKTPDAAYAMYPVSPASYDQGYLTITYKDLANAANGCAWWLQSTIGPSTTCEALAYVGPNDVRYYALVLGALKAGYVIFLTSPRNSELAHKKLFDGLECRTLITSSPKPPVADPILSATAARHLEIPSVSELLNTRYDRYPFEKTYESARSEPAWILHTSGSTGIPKPIVYTHECVAKAAHMNAEPPPDGFRLLGHLFHGKRTVTTLPPFHGAGLFVHLVDAVMFGSLMVSPAATGIATAQGVVEAVKRTGARVATLVPSIVSELADDEELLEFCSRSLELILYIGGDLPKAIGDRVASKVPLRCQYGATEICITPQLVSPQLGRGDWGYVQFPSCMGVEFGSVTGDVHELVVKRDPQKADFQTTFTLVKGLTDEYRTRDLWEPHPTVPDNWRWRARADDIIVFLNGEKTNPVSMEQHITAENEEVAAALVIGAQRFQAALLVELIPDLGSKQLSTSEEAAIIQKIWPSIEDSNKSAPAHARIEKSLILLTKPSKPFIRAGKGTIQRGATVSQYIDEIDELYRNADAVDIEDEDRATISLETSDLPTICAFISRSLRAVTGWADIDVHSSFFDHGLDSLQALRLTRELRNGLSPDISLSTVYQNSSISQLAKAALAFKSDQANGDIETEAMTSILKTYQDLIHQLPASNIRKHTPPSTSLTVLLTGSTGTLGTHVLHALLANPKIAKVYCLNRRQGGKDIQQKNSQAAGLALRDGDTRVAYLHADLAKPNLGLRLDDYDDLRSSVDLIIHNAWPVNFNLALLSFRPQLAGLVNLFALAASSSRAPRTFFVSSMSSVKNLPIKSGKIPEAVIESFDVPLGNGYSRSKFLAELLCATAARQLGISITVARLGQVAGPTTGPGIWSTNEWLPGLVVSSMHIGSLPDDLGPVFSAVDWMPVDLVAQAIVEINTTVSTDENPDPPLDMINILNPRHTTWHAVLPVIVSSIESLLGKTLAIEPFETWLAKVQASAHDMLRVGQAANIESLVALSPAVRLLDFYARGLSGQSNESSLATDLATARSRILREMPAVGNDWIRKWIVDWVKARPVLDHDGRP